MTILIAVALVVAALIFSAWYVHSRPRRPGALSDKTASALDQALHELIDEVSSEIPLPRGTRRTGRRHLEGQAQQAFDDEVTGPRPSSGPSGGLAGHGLFH